MKTITKTPNQLPGLIALFIIPVWNIRSIVGTLIDVYDHTQRILIECATDTLHHNFTHRQSKAGNEYNHQITATIQGRSDNTDTLLSTYSKSKYIVLLMDDNQTWKRIGEPENGMRLTYNFETERPAYNITLSGRQTYASKPAAIQMKSAGSNIDLPPGHVTPTE